MSFIQKSNGQATIRNTQIPIWRVMSYYKESLDDYPILKDYPVLTLSDLLTAREYYEDNVSEIENLINNEKV